MVDYAEHWVWCHGSLLFEMENFLKRRHDAIRMIAVRRDKKFRHLTLPLFIDGTLCHLLPRLPEVVRFQIPDEQPIRTEEQRIISPAAFTKSLLHFRPNSAMSMSVLL